MQTSKPILHAPNPVYSVERGQPSMNWSAVWRNAALVAAFVFLSACVLGAI